jgi:hypothetical protein
MSVRPRVLLPVAVILLGLTACESTPAAAPRSAAPPSSAPTSAAVAPSSAAPKATAPATSRPVATRTPDRPAGVAKCPSAKALEKLADLPEDWYFVPSTVECWKGWARATPDGPDHGDGFYLFRYKAGNGWKYHSQGSAYECQELGIKEESPFCG